MLHSMSVAKATECGNRQQEVVLNRKRRIMMKSRREVVRSISVVLALIASGEFAFAKLRRDPLYGLDTDNDRSVDLEEAKRAAISFV